VVSTSNSNVAVVLQRSIANTVAIDAILLIYESGFAHDDLALELAVKMSETRKARLLVLKIEGSNATQVEQNNKIMNLLYSRNLIGKAYLTLLFVIIYYFSRI
jgi:hypothetical protein